jgi:hypothetical protein
MNNSYRSFGSLARARVRLDGNAPERGRAGFSTRGRTVRRAADPTGDFAGWRTIGRKPGPIASLPGPSGTACAATRTS